MRLQRSSFVRFKRVSGIFRQFNASFKGVLEGLESFPMNVGGFEGLQEFQGVL